MIGLLQVAAAITIVAAATASAQGLIEKPSLAVGDRWTYKIVDMKKGEEASTYQSQVTAVSGDNIELQRTTLSSVNQQAVGQKTTDKVDIADVDLCEFAVDRGQVCCDRVSDRARQELAIRVQD
jgi:hypothetical protein